MTNEKYEELVENLNTLLTDALEDADLMQIVSNANSWNGGLEDLYYHENDENFFEMAFKETIDAVRAVSFGEYDYTDEWVKFNGHGNLESVSNFELERLLKSSVREIAEYLSDNIDNVTTGDDDLDELINLINEGRMEVLTPEQLQVILKDEMQVQEEFLSELNFDTMSLSELDELLTDMEVNSELAFYAITDELEEAVLNMDSNVTLYQVNDFYLVFG